MISIKRYNPEDRNIWNEFNRNSKNGLFMFDRNYMEYHSDRFCDHSLLFYNDDELVGLLPASERDRRIITHGGLTFGGLVLSDRAKQVSVNAYFEELVLYLKENNICEMIYKTIPYIYHKQPAEEDRFALFANKAELINVDVSTYVLLKCPPKMPKGRKAQISRAKREGVSVEERVDLADFKEFIRVENDRLREKYNTKAVHSGEELKMLRDRFPDNIHLYVALMKNEIIAGAVVYEYDTVVHTQYMATNEEARRIGALDLVVDSIKKHYETSKTWLDFGISTEHDRLYLNEGLVAQKESFGGRTGVYETWKMTIN